MFPHLYSFECDEFHIKAVLLAKDLKDLVVYIDKYPVQGASFSYVLTSCSKHGRVDIVGVLLAESIHLCAKMIDENLQSKLLFADLDICAKVKQAYLSYSSVFNQISKNQEE